MSLQYSKPVTGRTPFGVFHNLDCPDEETGYFSIHILKHRFSIYWSRMIDNNKTYTCAGCEPDEQHPDVDYCDDCGGE